MGLLRYAWTVLVLFLIVFVLTAIFLMNELQYGLPSQQEKLPPFDPYQTDQSGISLQSDAGASELTSTSVRDVAHRVTATRLMRKRRIAHHQKSIPSPLSPSVNPAVKPPMISRAIKIGSDESHGSVRQIVDTVGKKKTWVIEMEIHRHDLYNSDYAKDHEFSFHLLATAEEIDPQKVNDVSLEHEPKTISEWPPFLLQRDETIDSFQLVVADEVAFEPDPNLHYTMMLMDCNNKQVVSLILLDFSACYEK
jgi:hypothetical protein